MNLKGIKRPPGSTLLYKQKKKKKKELNQVPVGLTQSECVSSQPRAPTQKASLSWAQRQQAFAWLPQSTLSILHRDREAHAQPCSLGAG